VSTEHVTASPATSLDKRRSVRDTIPRKGRKL